MNRILFEREELCADGILAISDVRAQHIASVLRVEPGSFVRVGQIDGAAGRAEVLEVSPDKVLLRPELECAPAAPGIDLLLALPRPKVMRRLWAQLSALGVGRIFLVNANRVERCYFDTHWLQPKTYRPLLVEGLQQSGDTRLPDVQIHRSFRVLVEDVIPELYGEDVMRVLAHPGGSGLSSNEGAVKRVLLAVGPEGGWVPFELDLLQSLKFIPFSLGWRTLRTDTACIALLSVVSNWLSGENSE